MKLPGPLIEYLINDSVAMIWMFPFMQKELAFFGEGKIVLIPIIYVVGMFIDFIAFVLSRIPKKKLKSILEKNYLGESNKHCPGMGKEMKIKVLSNFPELAKEIETRNGRDRIARGMVINSIFLIFFSKIMPWWLSLILLVLSIIMWVTFEYSSHGFVVKAYEATKNES